MLKEEQIAGILKEVNFHTSRSGGKGGQNVNKVETKVEIEFNVRASFTLSWQQKNIILSKYPNLIDESTIKIVGNIHRSQLENKEEAKKKLVSILNKLLKPVKKRIATKPSKGSKLRKLEGKKRQGEKKVLRRKII